MITKHRVALNGVYLDSLDDRIITQSVSEPAAKVSVKTANRGGRYGGQYPGEMAPDRKDIVVTFGFAIRSREEWEERDDLFDKVMLWARDGGILTMDHRGGKQIRVRCTAFPEYIDPAKWAEDYKITFTAYEVPYWEDVEGTSFEVASTAGMTRQMVINGSAGTMVDFSAKNVSGARINTMRIAAGAEFFEFSDLRLDAGETLTADHDDDGRLRLMITGAGGAVRSAMGKRTGLSSDELYVMPPAVNIAFYAGGACRLTVTSRGRYI